MDYNDVHLFVRVVDAGSFAAAARQIGQQKSAVSRGVARLEKALGTRLLQRTTRSLSLTDAGRRFYDQVSPAVTGLDEAVLEVTELGGAPRGVVRVTAPPDSHSFGLAELMAKFVERHPGIRVDLALTSRKVDVVAERFDMALRAGPLPDSSLVVRKLGSDDVALFASPGYLERRGRPKALADLAKHDCVILGARNGRGTWHLTGPEGPTSVVVTGRLNVDDMTFATRATIAGAGIALLPSTLSHEPVSEGVLDRVLPGYRLTGSALHLLLPSSKHVPARVALLRDFLVEHLSRDLRTASRTCTAARASKPRRARA